MSQISQAIVTMKIMEGLKTGVQVVFLLNLSNYLILPIVYLICANHTLSMIAPRSP